MSSIGAEVKQHWQTAAPGIMALVAQNSQDNDDDEITLFNHSERSAFKKFRPLLSSTIIRANYHPLNVDYNENPVICSESQQPSLDPPENYLTSEKTHFCPILSNGHMFTIENKWDEIQWERSSDGGLMYKNRRYKIWNNSKKLPNIENDIDIVEMENDSSELVLKYILRENDKGCQANESDFIKTKLSSSAAVISKNRSFLEINEDYCKQKIYDEYFKGINSDTSAESRNKWRYVNTNGDDSNDYSFFTVNRVKNNNNNNNNLTSQTFQDILLSSNSSSSSICTITSSSTYDVSESWRNARNENNIINSNNNLADSEYKQTCMHRLWEQCVVCAQMNEDPYADKSLPANRLMKDELQLDGDEIMNVIQNLYITSDYCEDDEEKEDCEEFDMNHVYMNMILDDSMDGTCTIEEDENKFYESNVDVRNTKNQKNHHHHHQKDVFNLENFDEITLTQWQWNKKSEKDKSDHENYLKLLNWIKTSLVKNNFNSNINNIDNNNTTADTNNNDCQNLNEVIHRPKNRKRRHSTCQNLLENKRYHSHEEGFTYHLNLDNSITPSFLEDNSTNLFFDAAKMLKINIEKILLIHADPCFADGSFTNDLLVKDSTTNYKDQIGGANYYRNILQQQHALIKQLDLSRPLTR